MQTQAYVEHGALKKQSALIYLIIWLTGGLVKGVRRYTCSKIVLTAIQVWNIRSVFYLGRFRMLYNQAIEQSILSASVHIDLETREREQTKTLLNAAHRLVIHECSLTTKPLLPETLIQLAFSRLSLPSVFGSALRQAL